MINLRYYKEMARLVTDYYGIAERDRKALINDLLSISEGQLKQYEKCFPSVDPGPPNGGGGPPKPNPHLEDKMNFRKLRDGLNGSGISEGDKNALFDWLASLTDEQVESLEALFPAENPAIAEAEAASAPAAESADSSEGEDDTEGEEGDKPKRRRHR